ncbi:zinc finger domain-containing protein [Tessaracoccus sp.]
MSNGQRRYNVLGQDLGGYKAPRDVFIQSRSVPCPECGAAPEVFCSNLTTGEPVAAHRARRRMAVRARNAAG